MVTLRFRVLARRDRWNWWHACNTPAWGVEWSELVDPMVAARVKGASQLEAYAFLRDYLDRVYQVRATDLAFFRGPLRTAWCERGDAILARLEALHDRPFPVAQVEVYFTSFPRGPYGYTKECFWLALPIYDKNVDRSLAAIVHELFHLFFEWYYWVGCRRYGLIDEEIGHLKEAMSVLVNVAFRDLIWYEDVGYAMHVPLRRRLLALWERDGTFPSLVEAVCRDIHREPSLLPR